MTVAVVGDEHLDHKEGPGQENELAHVARRDTSGVSSDPPPGVRRTYSPEEVAALICWLASEECSFSTGATFDISGGRAVY